MGAKAKRWMAVYAVLVLTMVCGATTAFAATDPLQVVNNRLTSFSA